MAAAAAAGSSPSTGSHRARSSAPAAAALRAAAALAWRRASRPNSAGSPSPTRIRVAGALPGRSRVRLWPALPSKRRRRSSPSRPSPTSSSARERPLPVASAKRPTTRVSPVQVSFREPLKAGQRNSMLPGRMGRDRSQRRPAAQAGGSAVKGVAQRSRVSLLKGGSQRRIRACSRARRGATAAGTSHQKRMLGRASSPTRASASP